MIEVTLAEAQERLELLVEQARCGEEIFIVSETDRERIARIEAVQFTSGRGRSPGLFKGEFELGPGFFEPLPEDELRLWNCEEDEEKNLMDNAGSQSDQDAKAGDDRLQIATQRQRIRKTQEQLASLIGPERSLSEELIAERRQQAKTNEKR